MRSYPPLVAGLVSCTLGCSSAYVPQPGPRLSVIMDHGSLAYVRDGKKYEGGLFGGDIEEAVQGNAEAELYAHKYKTGMEAGFATTMGGVAGLLGGLVVTGLGAESQTKNLTVPVTGLVIMGVGLVAYLTGAFVMLNAVPHLYDAVNAYNDGVPPPPAP
jgi:hypothetical protein